MGQLPQPRSDLAVATVTSGHGADAATTAYLVGGYDGTTYLPGVLATTERHRTSPRWPPCPSRSATRPWWPTGAWSTPSAARPPRPGPPPRPPTPSSAIDPATHRATVVGHLPQALYGAAAYLLDGTIYVAGGQSPGGTTLTQITAFVPSTRKVLRPASSPRPPPSAGYATVGSGQGAVGYWWAAR